MEPWGTPGVHGGRHLPPLGSRHLLSRGQREARFCRSKGNPEWLPDSVARRLLIAPLIDSEFLRFELRQQTDGNSLDLIDAG